MFFFGRTFDDRLVSATGRLCTLICGVYSPVKDSVQVKHSCLEHDEEEKHDCYVAKEVGPIEACARHVACHSQQHGEREKGEPYVEMN